MTFDDLKEHHDFLRANPNFTGVCIVLHESGQKLYEHYYVNGEKHGAQCGWYPNGQKIYDEYFVNGKQHGKQTGWYENGRKSYEFNYVNGYRIGFHFYDGGKPYEMKLGKNTIWYILVKETL